jgi:PPOX class probable F420-dependent enzyme
MAFQLPDPATPFGERVARRLREESIIWLTTVDAKGAPQPAPIWFLWDQDTTTFLIYSLNEAKRHAHIQRNPVVALNFDGNGSGGDIIVLTGRAEIRSDEISADKVPAFVEKYHSFLHNPASFSNPEAYAQRYSVAIRVQPTSIRGH